MLSLSRDCCLVHVRFAILCEKNHRVVFNYFLNAVNYYIMSKVDVAIDDAPAYASFFGAMGSASAIIFTGNERICRVMYCV